MKNWHWIIALLYGLTLIIVFIPLIAALLRPVMAAPVVETIKNFFLQWQFWLWFAIMVVTQAVLLRVCVDGAVRRPVTKKSVLLPILTCGFAAGMLIIGVVFCIAETLMQTNLYTEKNTAILIVISLATLAMAWSVWAVVFYRRMKGLQTITIIEKQCALLFRASILELLIALPTHIIARSRDYCCAGFATFIGITLGVAIMFFSFGPGIFFLYYERWKKIHPK